MFLLVACFSLSLQRNYKKFREMDGIYLAASMLCCVAVFWVVYFLFLEDKGKKDLNHETKR